MGPYGHPRRADDKFEQRGMTRAMGLSMLRSSWPSSRELDAVINGTLGATTMRFGGVSPRLRSM